MAETLDETLGDLREISRGPHPAIPTRRGIRPAPAALARRCPVAVNLNVSARRRLSERIETTIYHVARESGPVAGLTELVVELPANGG